MAFKKWISHIAYEIQFQKENTFLWHILSHHWKELHERLLT